MICSMVFLLLSLYAHYDIEPWPGLSDITGIEFSFILIFILGFSFLYLAPLSSFSCALVLSAKCYFLSLIQLFNFLVIKGLLLGKTLMVLVWATLPSKKFVWEVIVSMSRQRKYPILCPQSSPWVSLRPFGRRYITLCSNFPRGSWQTALYTF